MTETIFIREVEEIDSRDLWLWRNNPSVRKSFFNSEEVAWEAHEKWFKERLKSKDTKIYIAIENTGKVGVIRFEIEKEIAKVSVNLNPEHFGRHLGSKIIKLGTDLFLREMKIIVLVLAEIKKENIPSQKAFGKAGYLLKEQDQNKVVYEYKRS